MFKKCERMIFKNVIFLLKWSRLIVMLPLGYLRTMNLDLRNVLLEFGLVQFIHAGDNFHKYPPVPSVHQHRSQAERAKRESNTDDYFSAGHGPKLP